MIATLGHMPVRGVRGRWLRRFVARLAVGVVVCGLAVAVMVVVVWPVSTSRLQRKASTGDLIGARFTLVQMRYGPADSTQNRHFPQWSATFTDPLWVDTSVVVAVRVDVDGRVTETAVFEVNDDSPSAPWITRRGAAKGP